MGVYPIPCSTKSWAKWLWVVILHLFAQQLANAKITTPDLAGGMVYKFDIERESMVSVIPGIQVALGKLPGKAEHAPVNPGKDNTLEKERTLRSQPPQVPKQPPREQF